MIGLGPFCEPETVTLGVGLARYHVSKSFDVAAHCLVIEEVDHYRVLNMSTGRSWTPSSKSESKACCKR